MSDATFRAAVLHFETADNDEPDTANQHSSACAVGWQVLEFDDEVTLVGEAGRQLVRPPANRFTGHDEHGISADDTADAPDLLTFWGDTLLPIFRELGVSRYAAHPAEFHIPVMTYSLFNAEAINAYAARRNLATRAELVESIDGDYVRPLDGFDRTPACSKKGAEALWPQLAPHTLEHLAAQFDIALSRHDPASAARAAAELLRVVSLFSHLRDECGLAGGDDVAVAKLLTGHSTVPTEALLVGLAVPGLTDEACAALAARYDTLEAIAAAHADELARVHHVDPATARALTAHLHDPRHRDLFG